MSRWNSDEKRNKLEANKKLQLPERFANGLNVGWGTLDEHYQRNSTREEEEEELEKSRQQGNQEQQRYWPLGVTDMSLNI